MTIVAKAEFLLIDGTQGRATAVANGVRVKGIPGVLEEAADQRLVNLPEAITKLRATSMFLTDDVVQKVLGRHHERTSSQFPQATTRLRTSDVVNGPTGVAE